MKHELCFNNYFTVIPNLPSVIPAQVVCLPAGRESIGERPKTKIIIIKKESANYICILVNKRNGKLD